MRIFQHLLSTVLGIHLCFPPSLIAAEIDALQLLQNQLAEITYAATPLLSFELPKNVFILDDTINPSAPSQATLRRFAAETGIHLVQLVVVWQDLTIGAFVTGSNDLSFAFAQGSGYTTQKSFTKLMTCLQDANQVLKTKLDKEEVDLYNYPLGGGNLSCGYHALRNLHILSRFFEQENNIIRLADLMDITQVNRLFGYELVPTLIFQNNHVPAWRDAIINRNKHLPQAEEVVGYVSSTDGEWLTAADVSFLANEVETKSLNSTKNLLPKDSWNVYQSTANLQNAQQWIRNIKTRHTTIFAIIHEVNHWYGLAIRCKKNGPIECIIVDSKNKPRSDSDAVKNLVAAVSKDPDFTLKKLESLHEVIALDGKIKLQIKNMDYLASVANITDKITISNTLKQLLPIEQPTEISYIAQNFAIFAKKRTNKVDLEKLIKILTQVLMQTQKAFRTEDAVINEIESSWIV